MIPNGRGSLYAVFFAILAVAALPATAQTEYPSRPIRVIVPFSVGSGSDTLGRVIGEQLAQQLSVPVVIENREGAGSNIANAAVAKASADGYTLLLATSLMSMAVHLSSPPAYDPAKDFAAIGKVAEIPMLVVASSSAPYRTMAELVSYAKANPGKVNYATSGKGSSAHLFTEQLKREHRFDAQDVPYKSVAQATADVATGKVDFYLANLPIARGLIQGGQLRVLAVGSKRRLDAIPDAPTLAEATGNPNAEMGLWYGLAAPAGTPSAVISRLNRELTKALEVSMVRTRIESTGGVVSTAGPSEFDAQIRSDTQKYGRLVKELGLGGS